MTKATPGPWQSRFIYRMIKAARQAKGLIIAAPPDNDWADARLMAAAPDLLDACKANLEFMTGNLSKIDDIVDLAEKCKRLTAEAVAKAERDDEEVEPIKGLERFLDVLGDHLEKTDPEWCKETSRKLETFEEWMVRRNSEGVDI